MGTRNLTIAVSNGETKVAQYGQWDGYPSGQGTTILAFLLKADLAKFKERLNAVKWLSNEDEAKIDAIPNWKEAYPYLSRDMAGEILDYVYNNDVIGLSDQSNFAADSLFCEYAYVVDLDKNTFEIYQGFNKTPLTEEDRFFNLTPKERTEAYYPVKIIKTYQLDNLPSEQQFLSDLEPIEED